MAREKLKLGQPVRYSDTIRRTGDFQGERGTPDRRYVKKWIRTGDWSLVIRAQPGRGVLVGLRTLQDGWQPYPLNEDDRQAFGGFTRTTSHQAAIIATHLHKKPVLAFLQDVSPLEEE